MAKRKQIWIALLSATVLLVSCLCGAFTVAADDEAPAIEWRETDDGQFLYTHVHHYGRYADQNCVRVVYIGDDTDVTVPAAYDGEPADVVWFCNEIFHLELMYEEGSEERTRAEEWTAKIHAAAERHLDITFEEGPTVVEVKPQQWPACVLARSVTLPKSAISATLNLEGTETIVAPAESRLTEIYIHPELERVPEPTPTTIDLTAATELKIFHVDREDYIADCYAEGSILKLPTEFKDFPLLKGYTPFGVDTPHGLIDIDPMLIIQYADGNEIIWAGDANGDADVDMKDVLLTRQHIAHVEKADIPKVVIKGADFNRDDNVDMKDVLLTRHYIATN